MPTPLSGRVVAVTGASRGLGYALAQRLGAAGASVAVCARSTDAVDALVARLIEAGTAAFGASVDVRDPAALQAFVTDAEAALGPLDAFINNAGVGGYKPLGEHTDDDIHSTIDINIKGVIFGCRAALPGMRARGRGHLINIASDLAARPLANMAVYVASKHAVLGFSQSLLREVKGDGVKVTCVNPGIIDTYFGGSEPGRDPAWSLRPEVVADAIINVLAQPANVVVDVLTLHPLGQDF